MIKITNIQAARTIGVLLILLSDNSFADSATPKSTYDWTGVYVGGFAGGASSAKTNTTFPAKTDGTHGWEPMFSSYNYETNASFIGGGTVGYNWQIGKTPYLVGLEGEYGYLGMKSSSVDPNSSPSIGMMGKSSTNVGSSYGYGLVGGRVGYSIDRMLFYIKSGAVFTNTQTNYNLSGIYNNLNTSGSSNTVGYGIGTGFEYALPFTWSTNISIKTEYIWLGINRTQMSSGIDTKNGDTYTTTDKISGISTAKIGVNYKF